MQEIVDHFKWCAGKIIDRDPPEELVDLMLQCCLRYEQQGIYKKYHDRDIAKVRMWNEIRLDLLESGTDEQVEKVKILEEGESIR